jgi:hypothetical protein
MLDGSSCKEEEKMKIVARGWVEKGGSIGRIVDGVN